MLQHSARLHDPAPLRVVAQQLHSLRDDLTRRLVELQGGCLRVAAVEPELFTLFCVRVGIVAREDAGARCCSVPELFAVADSFLALVQLAA